MANLSTEPENPPKRIRHPVKIRQGQLHAVPSKTSTGAKRKTPLEHGDAPDPKKRKKLIPTGTFTERLEHIVVAHRMKILPPKDVKYFIRHWRYDLDETMSFYKYYDEDNRSS